ncbi:MAG: hypothetical protein AAFY08_08490 [Planctomycetota bacterium]
MLRLRRDMPLLLVALLVAWGAMSLMPASPAFGQEDDEEDDRIEFMERDGDEDEEFDDEDEYEDYGEEFDRELAGFEVFFAELEAVTRVMDIVEQMTEVAKDPDASAIAAIISVSDHHDEREQVEFLEGVLQETSSETVRRAIRMQLIEVYKHSDRMDKAAEQARMLITGRN